MKEVVFFLGSCASILAICYILDEHRAERLVQFRAWLGKQLSEIISRDLGYWLRRANHAFLHWFDRLYGGRGTLTEQAIWCGLLLSPAILVVLSVFLVVGGDTGNRDTTSLLFLAVMVAFSISIGTTLPLMLTRISFLNGSLVGSAFAIGLGISAGLASIYERFFPQEGRGYPRMPTIGDFIGSISFVLA